MSPDWIKTRGGRDDLRTYCERCDGSFTVTLPISVKTVTDLVKAFVKAHRKCRQSPYSPAQPPSLPHFVAIAISSTSENLAL